MKYLEGIDYDTWWNSLEVPLRRDLEAARREETLDRRKNEVSDYLVNVSWKDVAPDQGGDRDAPVCFGVIHPRGGAGFQCEAEAIQFAIEQETSRSHLADLVVGVTKRIRWKDGDKLRMGTQAGLPAEDSEIVSKARFVELLEQARTKLGRSVE